MPDYRCIPRSGSESCARSLQGKDYHLGTFPDALSAAICYDRERTKVYGAKGYLNFPSGGSYSPDVRSVTSRPAQLTGKGAPRQDGPASSEVLPPSVDECDSLPVHATLEPKEADLLVSKITCCYWSGKLTSWGFPIERLSFDLQSLPVQRIHICSAYPPFSNP